jgi:hypothetical protein
MELCKNVLLDENNKPEITELDNGWYGVFCHCCGVVATKNPEEFLK